MKPTEHSAQSYRQIFKATAIIGGSSAVNVGLGVIRTKVLAVLLGPSGIGLLGIYTSLVSSAGALTGCGLSVSGVRQIAEAQASNDQRTVAGTRTALLRTAFVLAALGALVLFLFRRAISARTFGDADHTFEVGILAVALYFVVVGGAQGALLNGFQRIGDLARVNLISAVLSTLLAIVVSLSFGARGIVYILVGTAVFTFLTTRHYAARLGKIQSSHSRAEIQHQIKDLLKLGVVFVGTDFMAPGAQYLIRIVIGQKLGFEALGYFHAAWSISMVYVGFILNAMVKDYYPRLTALARDHGAMNRLVNQQTEIALLLSGPLMLGLLTFAPILTHLLYAPSFAAMNPILRWQSVGTLFNIASWPIGFIILAKGRASVFFFTELSWYALYISGICWGINHVGLISAGIAFFVAYLLYAGLISLITSRMTGFRLTGKNVNLIITLSICLFSTLLLTHFSPLLSYVIGSAFTVCFGIFSIRSLYSAVGQPGATSILNKIKSAFPNSRIPFKPQAHQ